jgi:hypothetical protein
MRLCRSLRWKSFYGASWNTPEDLAADLAASENPFSCLRTCQPWGPDDRPAFPSVCQPGRGCFQMSHKDPGTAPVT